jgi:hypothetical protein
MDTQILSKAFLRTQNVLRAFWRRWSTLYLPSLREHRQAKKGPIEEVVKIGDVAQVHQDCKRYEWKLAVVKQLNHGEDGTVRSVEIRTARWKCLSLLKIVFGQNQRKRAPWKQLLIFRRCQNSEIYLKIRSCGQS